ncbi:aldehyde dehydrogenase family protein [Endozoicomonas sp. GU-1]|uniref:aldehyde dehydrogenase family protein n=1 Tax=Endozoicomonas sp. GU-1 TaxID=3009078 RepID=UPI0022B2E36E|nr:aldehyde dehydrogenase family protein [Endozoicomonas sp. GU-1]WBA83139.1 aldehyde dehydrogenase family protein [Endozoicomonas sp. GU-1]WBA86063.1 aldehyde dehydrogenase family protein [Endozoicomonas sp. GU-1]
MATRTHVQWQAMVDGLEIRHQAWINGEYTDAASGGTFDCFSPVDGKFLTRVASCDEKDVNRAVAAARSTFESGVWCRKSPVACKKILQAFARKIEQHLEELALLESITMGKPINDALGDHIPGSANCISWCAEDIDKIYDEVAPCL